MFISHFTISAHPIAHVHVVFVIVVHTFQVVASVEGAKRDSGLLQYDRLAHRQKVSETKNKELRFVNRPFLV